MPARRVSAAPPPNTNLYCAQCDSQIGILENEWERLTSSYAKPKEKGLTFGLEVGEKTQAVPQGSAQKAAEGCMMAEVFCKKCSTTVAQFCKSAPHPSKDYLVNEQFFKLSRVYLKDAQTSERVEPTFIETDCASSQTLPTSIRSSIPPPPPPKRRASSVHESAPAPAFRQSHAPPLPSMHVLSTPQSQPSPAPPLTRLDGALTPQAFAPPVVHPSQYIYQQQQHFYDPASGSDPFQPIPIVLPREVIEQGAAIGECFHRLTSLTGRVEREVLQTTDLEARMTSTETKATVQEALLTSTRKSLEQLQTDHKTQATGCLLHDEKIQRQQTMIEDQQMDLKNVTEKLELLQKSMKELTSAMEENKTHSLVQRVSHSDSGDFLESLENMMRGIRDARPNDTELKALRDENMAMKARLKSIASAMGTSIEEDHALVEERASSQENDVIHVLGKRKRPLNNIDHVPKKISRQISELRVASHQEGPLLSTPGSTRPESRSSSGPQLCISENDKLDVGTKRSSSDCSRFQVQDDDDFVIVGDDGDGGVEPETIATAPKENSDSNSAELSCEAEETSLPNEESILSSKPTAVADIHQAHYTKDPPLPIVDAQGNQLVHIQKSESGLNNGWEHVPIYGPYAPTPWYGTPVHPAQYRPSFNGRGPGTHFLSGSGAMPAYFGSTIFPASQITSPYSAYITPAGQKSSLGGSDTFSGAISRGQRLEEIIQRPTKSSSVSKPNPSNKADVRATVLQSRQSNLSDRPTPVQPNKANDSGNAESIDFSDEENNVPPARPTTRPSQAALTLNTPISDLHRRVAGGTLVSRTVRGFTLEPLERPVINEPPPMPKPQPNTDAFRRSDGSRPASVMPEILAAIQNLNGSAARHAARPAAANFTARPSAASTAINASAAAEAKKSRKSEPVFHVSVDVVNHSSSIRTTQSTSGVQEENVDVLTPSKQAVSASSPPFKSGKDISDKDNTPAPTPATRGRPRKSGRPSDLQPRRTDQTSAARRSTDKNDDDCAVCDRGGNVLCCDGCPKVYHHRCLHPPMNPKDKLEGDWFCPQCIELRERKRKDAKDTAFKLQLREQVLMERNRLAQEAMDREDTAERHQK